MTDREFKRLVKILHLKMVRETIESLAAGNDTGCFSTDQFVQRWFKVACKEKGMNPMYEKLAERVLGKSRHVDRVKPGTWAVK